MVEREVDGWLEAEHAAGVISVFENGQALARMDLERASPAILERVAQGRALKAGTVEKARRTARRFKTALRFTLEEADADAVLTPTWPFAAPLIEATDAVIDGRLVSIDQRRNCFVRLANGVNACAITLPAGLYPVEKVPFGIHLTSPGGYEARLLATARAVEAALPAPPRLPLLDAQQS
jgi:Asp-tRNA(Asn)/Glu-tRNA(Gln) amidotransferase A subunit family amidase